MRINVIPLLIIFCVLSLGMRLVDVTKASQNLIFFKPNQALAEEKKEEKSTEQAAQKDVLIIEEETPEDEKEDVAKKEIDIPELLQGLTLLAGEEGFDVNFAQEEIALLQDLANRRKTLDERERLLDQKEAVLKATNTQIDQKITELTGLKQELQDLLNQQSMEEQKRIRSLVKIYEGMKPKDAARIMNTLETDILLAVFAQMSERRSAPIMAEMESDRAREITTLLAEQKQLPDVEF